MSESRNSESRYVPSYPAYNGGESHSGESREPSFVPLRDTAPRVYEASNKPAYNNLDNIDELINRLEKELPTKKDSSVSPKVNAAYEERRRKIEELRQLQKEAREEEDRQRRIANAEAKVLPGIEAGNKELDQAIAQVKQMVKKPQPTYRPSTPAWDDGESHSSESRW